MSGESMLLKMILLHLLADYAWQGDFLARAKNHLNPIPDIPFWIPLLSHSAIHAILVYLVTDNYYYLVMELISHTIIDYLKSDGCLSFTQDQAAHISFKIIYWLGGLL